MEKDRQLPGLTPAWIIVLGSIVAALLPIGVPYMFKDDIRPPDWIGFAGNVIAAGVALFAAAIAWKAVQRQISAQVEIARAQMEIARGQMDITRRQNEMQRLTVLRERIAIMEDDKRAVNNIGKVAPAIGSIPGIVFKDGRVTRELWKFAEERFDEYSERLETAVQEFEVIGARRRSVKFNTVARSKLGMDIAEFEGKVITARKALIAATAPQISSVPAEALELSKFGDSIHKKCSDYALQLLGEIHRLDMLVAAIAEEVNL